MGADDHPVQVVLYPTWPGGIGGGNLEEGILIFENDDTLDIDILIEVINESEIEIKELVLNNNKLLQADFKKLIKALISHNSLTTLDLFNSKIGDEGAKQISFLLKNTKTLKRLYLGKNNINKAGIRSIVEVLNQTTLTTLLLRYSSLLVIFAIKFVQSRLSFSSRGEIKGPNISG